MSDRQAASAATPLPYPRRFRKRPVEIEAWQLSADNGSDLIQWMVNSDPRCPAIKADDLQALEIPTLEGVHRADVGDWIVRGVQGEFYPVKPDIFTATYECVWPDELRVEWMEDGTDEPGWFVFDALGPIEGSYALKSEAEEALHAREA